MIMAAEYYSQDRCRKGTRMRSAGLLITGLLAIILTVASNPSLRRMLLPEPPEAPNSTKCDLKVWVKPAFRILLLSEFERLRLYVAWGVHDSGFRIGNRISSCTSRSLHRNQPVKSSCFSPQAHQKKYISTACQHGSLFAQERSLRRRKA